MVESSKKVSVYIVFLLVLLFPNLSKGQQNFGESTIRFYEKNELNWGLKFRVNDEREELKTDFSKKLEEISLAQFKFLVNKKRWTFLDYKHEQLDFNFEFGPVWGSGNFEDSTKVRNRTGEQSILGIRFNGGFDYANRFYYNEKSYTIVQLSGKGNFDLMRKHSEGVAIDSNLVSTAFDSKSDKSKLRYGINASAGWGVGRLNPMNHVMVADYLFANYYAGRKFSSDESEQIIQKIEEIKRERSILKGHDNEAEMNRFLELLNKQLFLIQPEGFSEEWELGEFMPRFNGSRVEIGPFFSFYSQEPDFIYGGFIQVNNEKYCNYKWNRRINAGLNYSWYKYQDWMLAELELGWSYYSKLKNRFDFGIKYVPGVTLNYFEDIGQLNHGFIPYVGYYSQINTSTRLDLSASLRISNDDGLLLPGPEISIIVYKSRY